ncbi:hypothetical protein JK386_09845 [Nocardioides sp. zg-536]|uniref:YbjN domain-containing protein n=1 Tax=Nocardioides faecalis TaxID=2803858 RepID=A0A938YA19_9ACTN|nr:hypothetical protein [Nocardioides faecalis]MBM9460206.1 hypothetical protein [Nocardioides faecalis]QVI60002.1 hypothetical protein KG111_06760 [Nocardioides faecalis]
MAYDSHGGTPAEETCAAAWTEFEELLAVHLATMTDVDDHLIVELPEPPGGSAGGTAPYAQFAGCGDGVTVHGEISGDRYLAPQHRLGHAAQGLADAGFTLDFDEAGEPTNWVSEQPTERVAMLAQQCVFALRQVFGIAHPHLLTYQAWGPCAEQAEALGLWPSDEVPVEDAAAHDELAHDELAPEAGEPFPPPGDPDGRPLKTAYRPKTRARMLALVERTLSRRAQAKVETDDDGDFVLAHLGQPVFVRVLQDQPGVLIFARVAHDVRSRRGAAVETSILNRDHLWVKWDVRDRDVVQTLAIPGFPYAPDHLARMLDLYLDVLTTTRDDLVLRVAGRTA